MLHDVMRTPLLAAVTLAFSCAPAIGEDLKNVHVMSDQSGVTLRINVASSAGSVVRMFDHPSQISICLPKALFDGPAQKVSVRTNGVEDVSVEGGCGRESGTSIHIGVDSERPYRAVLSNNFLTITIPAHVPQKKSGEDELPDHRKAETSAAIHMNLPSASPGHSAPIEMESPRIEGVVKGTSQEAEEARHRFKVKFVAANNAYIDGGSNAGLRVGMDLNIVRVRSGDAASGHPEAAQATVGSAHVVGIATNSAILEIAPSAEQLKTGDFAELTSSNTATATRSATAPRVEKKEAAVLPLNSQETFMNSHLQARDIYPAARTRMSGRFGFDYSGIVSSGSTPGKSGELGLLFESHTQHILGSHWNLEGYWRGRVNRHSQFRQPTIDETLNKTYTMQLYYDNPDSRWAAGMGRLYLPWAVSLDTVDGGYLGRKSGFGMTTGIFAGSTPDISSWHYRPNQRIGGLFTNFEHGSYEGFHLSSTTGAALSSIKWKLDRPFLFFENEISYKGHVSLFHSMIVDSPRRVTTNRARPGAGVSHSYFTLHYQPTRAVGLDLYHNFFRDVPTATTTVVATGLVDKILFQGVSGGIHWNPRNLFSLYTTLGLSDRTGDMHHSFNRMFGGTWHDIAQSGVRADFHYSRFNSSVGNGDYSILTLSRQVTSHMLWNLQLASQDLLSQHSADYHSRFISDSVDVNLGRHSYLQSGYTLVDGATLNYHQWYMSLGYRFDAGKNNPEYVQTLTRH